MSLEADTIVDRRRLRRKLTFWRVLGVLLVIVAVLENCGYRQVNAWWSCVGTVQAMTRKGGWGVVKRRAFEGAPPADVSP